MFRLCISVLLFTLFLCLLSVSGVEREERSTGSDDDPTSAAERRSALPYWNLWASDFYGWVEELRAQAAYDMLLDLAKAYWAHSPLGSYLGYDSIPDEDEKEEKTDN
ncbi:otospiralin-like [Electrophorus electricus]|uniref:otospiralin-like n=1 Tax=Electrophorus electricus TaxID=8005 RepID=UPI0015D05E2E|nr:otospiralin-like [Electrophorus electricus]